MICRRNDGNGMGNGKNWTAQWSTRLLPAPASLSRQR